jgi:hypothetical protein
MSRPAVSVVMPFSGDALAASQAIDQLRGLATGAGDELILVDNAGTVANADGVLVLLAIAERSPAHARNVGAARAANDWILFIDADCLAANGLLDAYFRRPIAPDVGALAGEVVPAPGGQTLAERYGASKSFLGQQAHLAHPYRPRAVAANLLVRREAFERIGGFHEGVRAAEDTDFSWRLQDAGWKLELRAEAQVEHRYRATVRELRRQWRGYAAGRAWLSRRYSEFEPEPAVKRAFARARPRSPFHRSASPGGSASPAPGTGAGGVTPGRIERGRYLALDALLAGEELAGFTLSNRPTGVLRRFRGPASVVLVADRFPSQGDVLVDFARSLQGVRVEAAARPESVDPGVVSELSVEYREDDGAAARAVAFVRLLVRHPLRSARDVAIRGRGEESLAALAPVVLRLRRDPHARVQALGGDGARRAAQRVAALAGRALRQ